MASKIATKNLTPYLWVIPVLLVITALVLFPFFWTLWTSLHAKLIGGEATFVGLTNFKDILTSGTFTSSFVKTLLYTASAIILKLLIGMAAALALNRPFKGRNIVRGWLFIPWTLPKFALAIIFLWLLRFGGGINLMLGELGASPIFWLGPDHALTVVMAVNVWKGFPFFMVGILAGLQAIPQDLYDASAVDGASSLQQFAHVTLPALKDIVLVLSCLSTIWTFSEFDIVFMMTGGGPGTATEILPVLTYLTAFRRYDIGKGSAIAVLSLFFFLPLIFWLVKLISKAADV